MSLTNTLLKAGALYAIGRFGSKISAQDVAKVTGISGEDLRGYGTDRADALLDVLGLQRQSTVPSSTAMILSGFAAGAIVGAGVTFLFYSEQGAEVRKKVSEFFASKDESEDNKSAEDKTASANGNGGVTA